MNNKTLILIILTALYLLPTRPAIIVHGPFLQNVYENEATIVWETDCPTIGWIELAPDDSTAFFAESRPRYYDTKIGIRQTSYLHAVRLTGLSAGTTYRYRVMGLEVKKHEAYWALFGGYAHNKPPYAFTTLDSKKKNTSFIVLNDIHEDTMMMEKLVRKVDYNNRDMVIFNGDMMNYFQHDSTFFHGFMDEAVKLFASNKPLYYVRGNHETRGIMSAHFQDYICPRQPNLYFAWQQGPIFFIALDTGEDKPDDNEEYEGFTDYDAYRTEQAKWLEKVVKSEAFKNAKWRIVIGHIPPAMDKSAWHGDSDIRKKFVPILNNAGINLMICGHFHKFSYHPNVDGINFPVLVNSNNSIVDAQTSNGQLHLKILDIDGKEIFNHIY